MSFPPVVVLTSPPYFTFVFSAAATWRPCTAFSLAMNWFDQILGSHRIPSLAIFTFSLMVAISTTVCSSDTFALTGDLTNDPADIVKKYLSLDKRGARLEALSYETVRPYVAWEDEPPWGQVVVILEYTVSDDVREWEIVSSTEAVIPVTFQVVGVMHWESATFLPERREETVLVRVRAVLNRWKITEPMFPPHVGRKRLIDFVRNAILEEKNKERKEVLQRLRTSLGNAKS